MQLKELKDTLVNIKEIKPIGRFTKINQTICHVMGFTCDVEGNLQLYILEYKQEYQEKIYTITKEENIGTNRTKLRKELERSIDEIVTMDIEKVHIESLEFVVERSSCDICRIEQWEIMQLFTCFLKEGWNPSELDTKNLENIYLTTLIIEGKYNVIPEFNSSSTIQCLTRNNVKGQLVEQPVTLRIDNHDIKEIHLVGQDSKKVYTIQINRVYLLDMLCEMEKVFNDSRMKEFCSEEEIVQRKEEFETSFLKECPKGMCYPVIEYECDDEISLQFYSENFLKAEPINRNESAMYFLKPENPIGKSGMKLKAAIIQEPYPKEVKSIEAEIFSILEIEKSEDIII